VATDEQGVAGDHLVQGAYALHRSISLLKSPYPNLKLCKQSKRTTYIYRKLGTAPGQSKPAGLDQSTGDFFPQR
jgi:hypothetical protein